MFSFELLSLEEYLLMSSSVDPFLLEALIEMFMSSSKGFLSTELSSWDDSWFSLIKLEEISELARFSLRPGSSYWESPFSTWIARASSDGWSPIKDGLLSVGFTTFPPSLRVPYPLEDGLQLSPDPFWVIALSESFFSCVFFSISFFFSLASWASWSFQWVRYLWSRYIFRIDFSYLISWYLPTKEYNSFSSLARDSNLAISAYSSSEQSSVFFLNLRVFLWMNFLVAVSPRSASTLSNLDLIVFSFCMVYSFCNLEFFWIVGQLAWNRWKSYFRTFSSEWGTPGKIRMLRMSSFGNRSDCGLITYSWELSLLLAGELEFVLSVDISCGVTNCGVVEMLSLPACYPNVCSEN